MARTAATRHLPSVDASSSSSSNARAPFSFGFAPAPPKPIFTTPVPAVHRDLPDPRPPVSAPRPFSFTKPKTSSTLSSAPRQSLPSSFAPKAETKRATSTTNGTPPRMSGRARKAPIPRDDLPAAAVAYDFTPGTSSTANSRKRPPPVGTPSSSSAPSKKSKTAGEARNKSPKYEDWEDGSGTKRYTCPRPDCDQTFDRNFNLQSHLATHKGIREFACPDCFKSFSRRHDCLRHCVAVHKGDREEWKKRVTRVNPDPTPRKRTSDVVESASSVLKAKPSLGKKLESVGVSASLSTTSASTKRRGRDSSAGFARPAPVARSARIDSDRSRRASASAPGSGLGARFSARRMVINASASKKAIPDDLPPTPHSAGISMSIAPVASTSSVIDDEPQLEATASMTEYSIPSPPSVPSRSASSEPQSPMPDVMMDADVSDVPMDTAIPDPILPQFVPPKPASSVPVAVPEEPTPQAVPEAAQTAEAIAEAGNEAEMKDDDDDDHISRASPVLDDNVLHASTSAASAAVSPVVAEPSPPPSPMLDSATAQTPISSPSRESTASPVRASASAPVVAALTSASAQASTSSSSSTPAQSMPAQPQVIKGLKLAKGSKAPTESKAKKPKVVKVSKAPKVPKAPKAYVPKPPPAPTGPDLFTQNVLAYAGAPAPVPAIASTSATHALPPGSIESENERIIEGQLRQYSRPMEDLSREMQEAILRQKIFDDQVRYHLTHKRKTKYQPIVQGDKKPRPSQAMADKASRGYPATPRRKVNGEDPSSSASAPASISTVAWTPLTPSIVAWGASLSASFNTSTAAAAEPSSTPASTEDTAPKA